MSILQSAGHTITGLFSLTDNLVGFFNDGMEGLRGLSSIFRDQITPAWAASLSASADLNAKRRGFEVKVAEREFAELEKKAAAKARKPRAKKAAK